jgi:hypothetical protein
MLFFIICLLKDRFKGNGKGVNSSNKLSYLSKYLDLSVITRAKALKKLKDKLYFKEGS